MPPCVFTYFAQASVPSEIEERMAGPVSEEIVPNVRVVPVGAADVPASVVPAVPLSLPELLEHAAVSSETNAVVAIRVVNLLTPIDLARVSTS